MAFAFRPKAREGASCDYAMLSRLYLKEALAGTDTVLASHVMPDYIKRIEQALSAAREAVRLWDEVEKAYEAEKAKGGE